MVNFSAEMTRFFLFLTNLKFQKCVFSGAWALFRRTTLPTIEMSHFHWKKFARFRWCLPNLENQQKRQLVALLCFIEGMSIIFGFRCTKLLQIKVQFSRTPPWRIDSKFKDFLFLNDKILQIHRVRFEIFFGNLIWVLMNSKRSHFSWI